MKKNIFIVLYCISLSVIAEAIPLQKQYNIVNINNYKVSYLIRGEDYKQLSDIGISFSKSDGTLINSYSVKELIKKSDKICYKYSSGSNKWFYYWLAFGFSGEKISSKINDDTFSLILCDKTGYIFDIKSGKILKIFQDETAVNLIEHDIAINLIQDVKLDKTHVRYSLWGRNIEKFNDIGIAFYKDEKLIKEYTINQLVVDKSKIKFINTYDIYIWNAKVEFVPQNKPYMCIITSVDGHIYVFDIETGMILKTYIDNSIKVDLPEWLHAPQ